MKFISQQKPVTWTCAQCSFHALGSSNYIDLESKAQNGTADHYSMQWGEELDFLKFIQNKPSAKQVMPAARLGWDSLFLEIRNIASRERISVFDAACGFGGLANELICQEIIKNIIYVGADIHGSLNTIREGIPHFDECGVLVRWDISKPLPVDEKFDYVLCRASLHHTPDPRKSFSSLCAVLKPGGKIAISVYSKKGICREACDDSLREIISTLPTDQAFNVCKEFTLLGQALQRVKELVLVPQDLPLLGIRKGEYGVQELIYYHILKCFNNDEYGEKYSTLVNFDWYHPPYAYRFNIEDVLGWLVENNIELIEKKSIEVQHYVVGRKMSV